MLNIMCKCIAVKVREGQKHERELKYEGELVFPEIANIHCASLFIGNGRLVCFLIVSLTDELLW